MIQLPLSSVTTVLVNPVSVWVAVTVTPGSTAPLSSVTRPFNSAVACAHAPVAVISIIANTPKRRSMRIDIPFYVESATEKRIGAEPAPTQVRRVTTERLNARRFFEN
jgi:hypothetical protein